MSAHREPSIGTNLTPVESNIRDTSCRTSFRVSNSVRMAPPLMDLRYMRYLLMSVAAGAGADVGAVEGGAGAAMV